MELSTQRNYNIKLNEREAIWLSSILRVFPEDANALWQDELKFSKELLKLLERDQ